MCGIAGFLNRTAGEPPDVAILEAMKGAIAHRGPDDDGTYIDGPVALGMRRLSIIDLDTGEQPIGNEDGTVQIVFNGEIYNYPALRERLLALGHRFRTHSDTETVVHAYEEWGEGFLDELNGMFAFAIWDQNRRRLLLARDRAGIKPLYYARTRSSLVFASELKALLVHPEIERELDVESFGHYLSLEYVPTPRAILRGVRKLRPGHYLLADEESERVARYWDFEVERSESVSVGEPHRHAQEFSELLQETVAAEMISDVPVGVLLSGGLDSSAVAAMMTRVATGPVESFSVGFEESSFDESSHARGVAAHLGTRHHETVLSPSMLLEIIPKMAAHLDEPLADPSVMPTYLVSRFAREHVKVALGGDGGDEMLAGYSTLQAHRVAPLYNRLPAFVRERMVEPLARLLPVSHSDFSLDFKVNRFLRGSGRDAATQHQMWLGSFYGARKRSILAPEVLARVDAAPTPGFVNEVLLECAADHRLNRVLYQDMKLYMEGGILPKVDRASMAVSLETRVPLLNRDIMSFLAATPISLKLRGFTRKWLLREAMTGILPDDILKRPKKGFGIPIARWFGGELREMAQDYFSAERLRRQGLFDPVAVGDLFKDHVERRRNNHKMLWTLLMFQLWWENWMESG